MSIKKAGIYSHVEIVQMRCQPLDRFRDTGTERQVERRDTDTLRDRRVERLMR